MPYTAVTAVLYWTHILYVKHETHEYDSEIWSSIQRGKDLWRLGGYYILKEAFARVISFSVCCTCIEKRSPLPKKEKVLILTILRNSGGKHA